MCVLTQQGETNLPGCCHRYSLYTSHHPAIGQRRSVNGVLMPFISSQESKYASVKPFQTDPGSVGLSVFETNTQIYPDLFFSFFARRSKAERQRQWWKNVSLTSQAGLCCPSAASSHGIFRQIQLSLDYHCSHTHTHTQTTQIPKPAYAPPLLFYPCLQKALFNHFIRSFAWQIRLRLFPLPLTALTYIQYMNVSVCVCVCVCERGRKEE